MKETQGVFVASYQSPERDFPAFYTRSSNGIKAPYNFDSAFEAAKAIQATLNLNLGSGILIAAPVPQEFAMEEQKINDAISEALARAEREGVSGKETTPFILSAIAKITQGRSLSTSKLFK